jgi:hypothetical protein
LPSTTALKCREVLPGPRQGGLHVRSALIQRRRSWISLHREIR